MRSESERKGVKRRLGLRATRETANLSPGPAQWQGLRWPQGPVEAGGRSPTGLQKQQEEASVIRAAVELGRWSGEGERQFWGMDRVPTKEAGKAAGSGRS